MPVQVQALTEAKHNTAMDVDSGKAGDGSDIDLEFDQMDNKIIAATLKAFESGSLTPLIKEELRCTIQSRRLAEGKGEMKVEFKTPVKKTEMTEEERCRSLKRRKQNREAAQRFRQKQKDTSDFLSSKIKKLESSSKALATNLQRLKDERDLLKQMLDNHLLVCSNPNIIHSNVHWQPHDDVPVSTPSHFSTCSSITDTMSIADSVPDTATSDSSVFFTDDDPKLATVQPVIDIPTFGYGDENAEGNLEFDGQYLDVVCEETVVNFEDTDSEFDEGRRPESCSSTDTIMFKGQYCSADWNCLSQSMRGVTSAYTRAHLDSCSSQTFEPMSAELFLEQDVTP